MSQMLWSAGNDSFGCLGRPGEHRLSRLETEIPRLSMFSCGGGHNVFLTLDQRIFVCGYNDRGQLGPDEREYEVPTEVVLGLNPIWCDCGREMTAFLNSNGKVYVCGKYWDRTPVELTAPTDVVFIACGFEKVCGIGSGGEFYEWKEGNAVARMIPCETQFCDCAAGYYQVFGLSRTGVLYVYGAGNACGQGERWTNEEFREVLSLTGIKIRRIFAHDGHSLAIDESGRVFACGSNKFRECGLEDVETVSVFERLTIFDEHPVTLAALGCEFTTFVTEDLELYTCGSGDCFQLGNSVYMFVTTPTPSELAQGKSVMYVACGGWHMIIAENLEAMPKHPGRVHFGLE